MDLDERVAKVEVEVENNKEAIGRLERAIEELRASMERGFAEARASQAEQRTAMDRQFAELRKEMNTQFRWIYGLIFTNLTFTVGIIVHLAGII
ncbi:MAG TPA: hypothetical protein VGF27_13085 [Pseudoduganella sp.]